LGCWEQETREKNIKKERIFQKGRRSTGVLSSSNRFPHRPRAHNCEKLKGAYWEKGKRRGGRI